MKRLPTFAALIVLTFLSGSLALAQTRPSSRPFGGGGGGGRLDQLRSAIQSLDLTPDQKTKIRDLFQQTRDKIQALRGDGTGDRAAMLEKIQPIVADMRTRLQQILTPEQLEKLRGAMNEPTTRPTSRPAMTPSANTGDDAKPVAKAPESVDKPLGGGGLAVGSVAPDFALRKYDGPNLSLAQFKGKIVVLVFASYSSATFREHAPQLEQIAREYGNKIGTLVIYTKEAHPAGDGEIDRNKDNGINISQATTINDRIAAAKQMQSTLRLSVPVAVDAIDNATASAYSAESDTAYLIGRDGTILNHEKWFDPYAMRRAIDAALQSDKSST